MNFFDKKTKSEAITRPAAEFSDTLPSPASPAQFAGFAEPWLACTPLPKSEKLGYCITALGGPNFTRRLLSAKNETSEAYRQQRNDTEHGRISWTAALRLTTIYRHRFTFSTGLAYALVNERFHWENDPELRIRFNQTDTIVQTGRRLKTTYNRYHFLEVPLLVGYHLPAKNGGIAFNAGAFFNIWFRPWGDFLSPGGEPVSFTRGQHGAYPAFKKRAGVSLYGGTQFGYDLNERWRLLIEPYVFYHLTSLTKASYLLDQRYFSAGMQLGWQFRL